MRDDLDIPMPVSAGGFRVARRRPGLDANTRRLLLAASAIAGTLLLLVGAWSLTGHRASGLPVVEAANTPLKVKPADPGGMTVMGKDASILSGKSDGETVLAPPPEAPKLQALREQAAAEEAARKAAAEQAAREAAARLAARQAHEPKPAGGLAGQQTAQQVAPHQDAPHQDTPHQDRATPPAAQPVALRTTLPPVPPMPPAPPRPAPVRAAPAAAPAAARAVERAPARGGSQVQLAALHSEAAAMDEWHRLERRMPRLMDGRQPVVMKVEHDGRVFYRLRTGGFSGSGEAGRFCSEVKAKGGGCTVAAF